MKRTLLVLGFVATLSPSLFSPVSAFAEFLTIEAPEDQKSTMKTIAYQCNIGADKEKVEATYINIGNISLIDFEWKGERVIGANVIAASGTKYVGAQYIWWESKNEVALYDLINDPEETKPILCKKESTLLF